MKKIVSVYLVLLCFLLTLSGCGSEPVEVEPTWQDYYNLGIQAAEEENFQEALEQFNLAIGLEPDHPEVYSALADVYIAMEDLEKALETLQQGVKATGDETLEARAEEISAQLEALAGPQKPEYMVDYLGMTVNEVAALWGEDYTVVDDLYLGDQKGIYYEDLRTKTTFYFTDPLGKGVQTGEERIDLIETSADGKLAEGFVNNLTYTEMREKYPNGDFYAGSTETAASCTYQIGKDITLLYNWDYDVDPEAVPSSWATLYMEGLEEGELEEGLEATLNWRDIYEYELVQTLSTVSDPIACQYYIYDINGDGTPELIEGIGTSRANYTLHVYTVKNNSIYKLGEMFGDQIGVFGEQNTIFGYYAQMGYETILVYSMANDSITETARYEKESPNGYMNLTFLDSFALHDLSGLYWTKNSAAKNDSSLLNEFSDV